jgi:predicted DNA-binding antitoxin AbrB/MazE fold protein
MAQVNLNTLAREITLKEGKKLNLTIAQVKEVLKLTLVSLKTLTLEDLTELLRRVK